MPGIMIAVLLLVVKLIRDTQKEPKKVSEVLGGVLFLLKLAVRDSLTANHIAFWIRADYLQRTKTTVVIDASVTMWQKPKNCWAVEDCR